MYKLHAPEHRRVAFALSALPLSGELPVFAPAEAPAPRPAPTSGRVLVPGGTVFHVRLVRSLDTASDHAGDLFLVAIAAPIEVRGQVAIPAGASGEGHITAANQGGLLRGPAVLSIQLDSLLVRGRILPVVASSYTASGRKGIHIPAGTLLRLVLKAPIWL